jgi:hypothetical protein
MLNMLKADRHGTIALMAADGSQVTAVNAKHLNGDMR